MENTKTLEKILKICKKHGVKRLKLEKVEIEISDAALLKALLPLPKAKASQTPGLPEQDGDAMPSDDEMQFYSSGYAPEAPKQ